MKVQRSRERLRGEQEAEERRSWRRKGREYTCEMEEG